MTEWTKVRSCEQCGTNFTLKDHGHPGAWEAAEYLEAKIKGKKKSGKSADFFSVANCPPCSGKIVRTIMEDLIKKQMEIRKNLRWWKIWNYYDIIFGLIPTIVVGVTLGITFYLWELYGATKKIIYLILTYLACFPFAFFLVRFFWGRRFFAKTLKSNSERYRDRANLIFSIILGIICYNLFILIFGNP